MTHDGEILEKSSYANTAKDALEFAVHVKAKYGTCRAVCESTGNHSHVLRVSKPVDVMCW